MYPSYLEENLESEENLRLTDEQREQLETDICREIEASEDAKGSLPDRWQVNEDMYHVAPGITNLNIIEGMAAYNIPLWRPKADRIRGSAFKSLTAVYPYVQCLSGEPDGTSVSALERGLMNVLEHAKLGDKLKQSILDALNTNIGITRCRPVKKRGGLCFEIDRVHPKNMMCYPSHFGSVDEAKTIGHRFFKLLYRIKEGMRSGEYYDVPDLVGGDDPRIIERDDYSSLNRGSSDTIIKSEDSYVELWEVIHECDLDGNGEYKKYLCVMALRQKKLLSCQPYEYDTNWYTDWRTSTDEDRIWPQDSVAQTVQGPQKAYADIQTTKIQGSYQAAFPPVVITGGSLMTKARRYGPAEVWETTEDAKVFVIPITFNPGELETASQEMKECVDSLTGINRLGTGENVAATTTATAIDALVNAMDEAKDNYADAFSGSLERTFALCFMFIVHHFQEFKAYYGSKIPLNSLDELSDDIRFQATGRTSASSPSQMLKKLQIAREIAMNPESDYDLNKVDEKTMEQLDLPFDVRSLMKDGLTLIKQLVAQAEEIGIPADQIAEVIQGLIQSKIQEVIVQNALSQAGAGGGLPPVPNVETGQAGPLAAGRGLEGQMR